MSDIAINPVTRRVQFTGNTGTGPYAFTFNVLQSSDIVVYKNNVLLTETTDYTVSIAANGTGNITMVVALVLTDILTIIGGRELSRTTDFVTAGDLLASSLNEQLDSNVIMSQQLDERFGRTLAVPPGDEDKTLDLPLAADRADKIILFDESGNVTAAAPSDFFGNAVLGGNFIVNTATGDGSQTAFGLTVAPGIKTNIQIHIDGVYQNKSTFSLSGSTVTFTEAPPLNAAIEFMMGESVTTITGDASAITYNQGGTGAQDRTVENRLQDFISVKDFGAAGDGVVDDTAAIRAAIIANYSRTLFFPKGTYLVSETIDIDFGLTLQGEQGSVIKFASSITSSDASFHNIFTVFATTAASRNLSKFIMRDLEFDGSNIATSYWLENSSGTAITDPEADYVMGTGALASGITGTSLTAVLTGTAVSSVTINNGGSGWKGHPSFPYLSDDVLLHFSGGGGYGAQGFATISGGALTSVTITDGGKDYTSPPTVTARGGYAAIDLLADASVNRRNPNYTDVHGVIWLQNTQDCMIENCKFRDIAGRAIFDQGSLNLDINNCVFYRCGKKDGAFHVIYAQNSGANPSEHIKIRNCRSFDSDRSFAGFMPKAGGLIENCYIDRYKEAAIFINTVANDDGNQIVIKNNVIKNGTQSDIVCHAIEAGGVNNLIIDGNYIEDCDEYPLVLTGVTEGTVINNTFVNNGSRYTEPYAPFSERYNYETTSYPVAGRENGLEERPAFGTIGSLGSTASKWLSIKNNTVKESGRSDYPKYILKQSKSGTDNISRGGLVDGNVFNVPSDVTVLDASLSNVWEYPYFPRIRNNLNSDTTGPVVHYKQFAAAETGLYTVDVGFMPSYIQVFAAPNNATVGRSGQGYISFNGDAADNDFTFIFSVDVGTDAYGQMLTDEFVRTVAGDGTIKFSAEFQAWKETGFSANVITATEITNVRFVCYP